MIVTVAIDVAAWAGWGLIVGYCGAKLPASVLNGPLMSNALRTSHGERRLYRMIGIRRWKDRLPEAGRVFGGASKRQLGGHGSQALIAFRTETRRAELVHWADLAIWPMFFLWNPLALTIVMLLYGLAANLPCVAVQRYNRVRIEAALTRSLRKR